jgi:hypothetical protein
VVARKYRTVVAFALAATLVAPIAAFADKPL